MIRIRRKKKSPRLIRGRTDQETNERLIKSLRSSTRIRRATVRKIKSQKPRAIQIGRRRFVYETPEGFTAGLAIVRTTGRAFPGKRTTKTVLNALIHAI